MSTKTTFKRVALVAVAALGFGVMSVAPSSAAVGQADSLSAVSAATSDAITNVAATNVVTSSFVGDAGDTSTVTVSLVSSPASSGALPTIAAGGGTNVNAGAASISGRTATVSATAAGRATGFVTVSLTADVAGIYVVRIAPHSGSNAAALTWTVTAAAPDYAISTKTTSFIGAGTTVATEDAAVTTSKEIGSAAAVATITVLPKNAADVAISTGNSAFQITATVAGPGTVKVGTSAAGRAVTGAADDRTVTVYADGTAGVSTITLSVGTLVIATEKVTFYGAATTITPTVVKSILSGTTAAAGAITAIVTDAAGVPVYGQAVSSVSDTAATIAVAPVTCGSSDATGLVSCTLTGVAAGTANITLTATNTDGTVITSAAKSVRVSDGTATKVVYSFDKATYAPGETAKITATVSNAAGVMPAGTYTVLTGALTANYAIGSLPTTTPATVVAVGDTGQASYTVTMSTGISGTVSLTGTAATGVTATFGSADVVNEALDAALEAIDAAENARLAAEAAIEAATDAQAAAEQAGEDAVAAADAAGAAAMEAANAATAAAEEAGLAAVEAGEMAVAAAEAAGAIAQDALDAAIAATDAATDAVAAAEEAKASADAATEAATAAGAAVEALSTKVATLIAGLNAKITTLSNLLAKIAKKMNVK